MSGKEMTLDSIIYDIESQELYSILDQEIDVSMLSADEDEKVEDDIETETKVLKKTKAEEKKKLANIVNLFKEDLLKKKRKVVKKSKVTKVPGDACKQVFVDGKWQIELLGEAITSFHKYQDGWKKFGKLKVFEKLNQDLLYVCNEDDKLDFIYRKSDDSIVESSSDAVLIRAKRKTMAKAKTKKVKAKKGPTTKAKTVEKKPTKKAPEYTQVVHCKFRTETGHWVLYGEEKDNPENLIELRKFNVLAYVLTAWRTRSAKIIEAKQDTCHVYTEDGSAIDYTLIRGVQEYKPKSSNKTVIKTVTKTTKAVEKAIQKPLPILVHGTKSLKGERKEGFVTEINKRLITVKFISFLNKNMDYSQQFCAKTGDLMSSNPNHGWKIDLGDIKTA